MGPRNRTINHGHRGTIVLIQRLEWRQYIFLLYTSFIYLLFFDWLKDFYKIKEFCCKYNVHLLFHCTKCLIRVKWHVNSAWRVHYAETRHHRTDHLHAWKNYLRIEKDYLRLGKTMYGLKKDYLRLEVISVE